MNTQHAMPHPSGVPVFGSSIVRVEPDVSSLSFAVDALKPTPAEAFTDVRADADAVRAFLLRAQLTDVASSRISLEQEQSEDIGTVRAFDPGWISISAAVQIVYAFSTPPAEAVRT